MYSQFSESYNIICQLIPNLMSEFPHDDFAKAYLTELLKRIGNARANRALKAETRTADIWFKFNAKRYQKQYQQLGLLGELLTRDSLIEVFRNAASFVEIRACQGKLSYLEVELIRKAKRRNQNLAEDDLPELWLIMPTASDEVRESFAVQPTQHPGVYRFPRGQKVGLIVVHQLVQTEQTLWLRLLGRNGQQKNAIEEFSQTTLSNELCASIEELLASYRANLASRRELTPEEEELIMQLSETYLKKRQEWYEEGEQHGRQEGRQEGHQEGRYEERRSNVIGMLREGIALESIARITGLPIGTIHQLAQELEN
jgi:hypothetical protein